jgi:hypothetical protein
MTAFKIPSKPSINLKDKKPDARRFSVIPLRAMHDKRLTRGDIINLIALCSYCSPNGFTFVAHSTIAKLRGVSTPNVSRTLKKLERLGYFEQVRKGYSALRGSLKRVIYDEEIDLITQESNSGISIESIINREGEHMKRAAKKEATKARDINQTDSNTGITFEEALLVVSQHIKTDSDLLKLEHLITIGSKESEVIEAFKNIYSI